MKSILISADYFPPQVGGISHLMSGIASALGPDCVCCLTAQRADPIAGREHSVMKVYRRPAIFNAKWRSLRGAAWIAAISQIMLRERPQIAQLATAGEGPLGLWLRKWCGMPFVVYAHGNEVLNATQIDGHKLKVSLRMADRVLAVSRYTADLVQKIGVSPERIEIVNPGCDTKRFRPLHPRMDLKEKFVDGRYGDKLIVSVGNLVPRKGHDMVIRALCQLREIVPNFTYVIAGEGPYRVELEKLALDLGVRERVVFAGRISGEDLPDIYAISDVFVMPSREQINENDVEGFGIVFLEASACAKPVVGGHSGGIPDAIEDGVTGLLVNANDPKDIGAALARLLNDRDLAVRMGQQGRAWVNKNFTWTTTAKKVAGILQQVLQEKSTRSVPGALSLPVKSIVEDAHQGAPNSK